VIWRKTTLGLAEIKARSLAIDPASRNLLILIDGAKTEDMLLRFGIGVRPGQFQSLLALGLIEAIDDGAKRPVTSDPPPPPVSAPAVPQENPFATTLSQLISTYLGLAGFGLTDAVQRARSVTELQGIAENVIALIRQRKGNAAAEEVAWRLFARK
jgi:hypothetical protein